MILNIIDHRKRPYRWMQVAAIVEATSNDNGVADGDKAKADDPTQVICEERIGLSLAQAVDWANGFDIGVTLFLYDASEGT